MPDFSFPEKLEIGISQCLLGEKVRYDGTDKLSPLCTQRLGAHFHFRGICPEMGIGLGAPREPVSLYLDEQQQSLHARGRLTPDLDITAPLTAYARRQAAALAGIDGYILMPRSPSCGLDSSKVYDAKGRLTSARRSGLYAAELRRLLPLLPMVEETALHDTVQCENFVLRLYAWRRWRDLQAGGLTPARLQEFHARHKYLLMAHSPAAYRALGRLVAHAEGNKLQAVAQDYATHFMAALARPASRGGHANVLQHLAGYFKRDLEAPARQALQGLIESYYHGELELAVPLQQLQDYLRQYPNGYLAQQLYWQPYPLALRATIFNKAPDASGPGC